MEDCFYAILTPTQAALMLYGMPPPTPKETPEVMEEIFVKKEKLIEPEYVKILKDNVQLRKDIEHGTKKELSGTELDKFVNNAEKYLKRIKKLFQAIEEVSYLIVAPLDVPYFLLALGSVQFKFFYLVRCCRHSFLERINHRFRFVFHVSLIQIIGHSSQATLSRSDGGSQLCQSFAFLF